MKLKFNANVSKSEAIRRYFIGAALIGVVLVMPNAPAWLALFACYPIFTAMLQWDPTNSIFQLLVNKSGKNLQDAIFRKSAV